MAKISARGCTKLAGATRTRDAGDGFEARDMLALRSDGAILGKTKLRRKGETRWSDTTYGIRAKIKKGNDLRAVFNRYAERRGYESEGS